MHCGGPEESRDHVPSKVLLDDPLPANLIVCPACLECNRSFSLDEEYLACVLECTVAGSVNPEKIEREKISQLLRSNPRLVAMFEGAEQSVDGQIQWQVDTARVQNVLLKLARGHIAYEMNDPRLDEPSLFKFKPLMTMGVEERRAFESEPTEDVSYAPLWPEICSRAMQRLLIVEGGVYEEGWLTVQDGRYRFRIFQPECASVGVRLVIREYLACEVVWESKPATRQPFQHQLGD